MPRKPAIVRKPRLSRADQKARRAEEIMAATWALFAQKGYEGTTMEEVAECIGVTRYTVFYAYGDKQTLFLELWKNKVAESIEQAAPAMKAGASLRYNLQALARYTAGSHGAPDRTLHSLFFVIQTIALSRPDIAKKLKDVSSRIPDYLTGVIESSTLEPGQRLRAPASTIAATLAAVFNGLATIQFQTRPFELDAGHMFDVLQAIALEQGKP